MTCDSKVFIDGVLNEQWLFEESLIDGHCVSVASNDGDKNVLENHPKFTEINPENLLEFTKLLEPFLYLTFLAYPIHIYQEIQTRQLNNRCYSAVSYL